MTIFVADLADHASGVSIGDNARWEALRDNSARADDRVLANRHARADQDPRCKPDPVAKCHRQSLLDGFRRERGSTG